MSNFNKFIRIARWPSIILWIFLWFFRAYSEIEFTGFFDKIINSVDHNIPVDIITVTLLPLALGGVFLYASEPNDKSKKPREQFRNIWEKDKFYFLFTMIGAVGSLIFSVIWNLSQ